MYVSPLVSNNNNQLESNCWLVESPVLPILNAPLTFKLLLVINLHSPMLVSNRNPNALYANI